MELTGQIVLDSVYHSRSKGKNVENLPADIVVDNSISDLYRSTLMPFETLVISLC